MPSFSIFRAVSLLLLLALFHTSVKSQATNRNLTSTGCSDANSYTTCSETAAGKAQVCQTTAVQQGNQLALAACVCIYYIEMMNCYMANCWNRVYECEYQEYAIQYISECSSDLLTQIPFFPAPDNAPGSCSCNLGKLYLAVNGSENEGSNCLNSVAEGALLSDPVTTANKQVACACCGESGAISSFYNICPDTQPSLVGIDEVYTYIAGLGQPWAACSPYMSAYDCQAELNFTNVADGTFFTPEDIPPSGTATLSVVAGTVSAPPSGTLFSYTNYFDSTLYTITAAVNGKVAGIGGVTGVTTGDVPTMTVSLPLPSPTPNSGAVDVVKQRSQVLAVVCTLMVAFALR